MLSMLSGCCSHVGCVPTVVTLVTFQTWIAELISRRFRTATALAAAIGMELSPFTRGVSAGTLNLLNLLKLSKAAGEHPSKVLRLARKDYEAQLLEELYGTPNEAPLSPAHRELIAVWDGIPSDVQEHFAVLLRHARSVAQGQRERTGPATEGRTQRRRASSRRATAPTDRPGSD